VNGVAFHPTKNILASCSNDSTIKLWNTETGAVLWTVSCDSAVLNIDWHDNHIASGCHNGKINVFDAQSGDCLWTVSGHSDVVRSVSWSSDGTKLASGSNDKTVRIWEVATGKELSQLKGHRYVLSVCLPLPDFFISKLFFKKCAWIF